MRAKTVFRKIFFVTGCILTTLAVLITAAFTLFCAAEIAVEDRARTLPSYAREDISAIAAKPSWTPAEYETLSRQTGLSPSALDELCGEADRILKFQNALFYEGTLVHERLAPMTLRDMLEGYLAPLVSLEAGDVLVTSSNHALGWRHGHAALVLDSYGTTIEALLVGLPTEICINGTAWFRQNSNFIVLRLKDASQEERAAIAAWAEEHLAGVRYDLTVGVLSKKDQGEEPARTQCAHLVWQAYYHFGYDIDSDGGPVCTPRDIAGSDLFEVRQIYGFDPLQGW